MSANLDKSGYPRIADNGDTVWACCESAIGPTCQHRAPAPQSGYTPCACRDCMDIAISAEIRGTYAGPALCLPCVEAGCEMWQPGDTGSAYECQRDDAYGE